MLPDRTASTSGSNDWPRPSRFYRPRECSFHLGFSLGWHDPATRRHILTYDDQLARADSEYAARISAEAASDAERTARLAAEARIRELEERIRNGPTGA